MNKRVFDFAVAFFLLILLSPALLWIAAAVCIAIGRPVLFRQVRPGLNGKPFELLKFRSMTNERGSDGKLLSDAQRLTAFGRWLRRTSLDELPELINVLRGEMSLVGPRPLLMEYLPLYSREQFRRHEVQPGITGWAQVNGRNSLAWEEKFRLDLWYVEHRSMRLDMKILWLTLARVVTAQGVSQPGQATSDRFTGGER